MPRKVAKLENKRIKVYEMDTANLQNQIDTQRVRTMISMAYEIMRLVAIEGAGQVYLKNIAKPKHLWYDCDQEGNLTLYRMELRDGPPPSNPDRPPYLRDLDLIVDPLLLPDHILADIVPGGKMERRGIEIQQEKITNARALDEKTAEVMKETHLRTTAKG